MRQGTPQPIRYPEGLAWFVDTRTGEACSIKVYAESTIHIKIFGKDGLEWIKDEGFYPSKEVLTAYENPTKSKEIG
jgi:hypothetical protein